MFDTFPVVTLQVLMVMLALQPRLAFTCLLERE